MLDAVSSTLDTVTPYIYNRIDSIVASKSKLGISCLLINLGREPHMSWSDLGKNLGYSTILMRIGLYLIGRMILIP